MRARSGPIKGPRHATLVVGGAARRSRSQISSSSPPNEEALASHCDPYAVQEAPCLPSTLNRVAEVFPLLTDTKNVIGCR